MKKILTTLSLVLVFGALRAQETKAKTDSASNDDLLKSLTTDDKKQPVQAAFKTTRLTLTETTETNKKHNLNFLVIHRFGDFASADGGSKTLYGLDNSSDIYIGFEYGLTDNLDIDFGRSKIEQLVELGFKYNFLKQTMDNSSPVAVTFVGKTALRPYQVTTNVFDDYTNRLNYFGQLIIARKFSTAISFELAPSFLRNNLPFPFIAGNEQNIFSLSAAGRVKVTKHMGIVIDYAHPFSNFRNNNVFPRFYDPLAVGIEIETGGHVFSLNFTNAQGISPFNSISGTESNWLKGQYRLGFTISRVFDLNPKHKGTYK